MAGKMDWLDLTYLSLPLQGPGTHAASQPQASSASESLLPKTSVSKDQHWPHLPQEGSPVTPATWPPP